MMREVLMLLLAYVVGSVPSGYLLVRRFRGKDVRSFGSHNVGTINVFRVGGRMLGILTLVLDAGKAMLMVMLADLLTGEPCVIAGTALSVMLGHAYSAWFLIRERRFSEGKSVACALGVMVAIGVIGELPWWSAVMPIGVWIVALVGPRLMSGRWQCVSVATMAATVSMPVAFRLGNAATPYMIGSIAMALLILVRHKNNIRRLLAGAEPRLGERHADRCPA